MASAEFRNISQEISKLKSGLMNFHAREDGAYTDEELLKCRAFIAFSHAEVETYLEKIASRILEESYNQWKTRAVYGLVIATLLIFRSQREVAIPDNPMPPTKNAVPDVISDAFKMQRKAIAANNGIKRNNLSTMLLPLGILPDDLDELMLTQLDEMGKRRGEMVHKPNKVSLQNIRDPFTGEQHDIDQLIAAIGTLDDKLEALGRLSVQSAPIAGGPIT